MSSTGSTRGVSELDPTRARIACVYCGEPIRSEDVPAVDDEVAWRFTALGHLGSCEWIITRAHRINLQGGA